MVHQELSLVPQLSVAENIFLGRQPAGWLGWISLAEMRRRAGELSVQVDMNLDPDIPVGELSIAGQQRVEILRALAFESELIILDEPTSPLSEHECTELFKTLGKLRDRGVSIVYISHRLEEVFQVADRLTVLKDGMTVTTTGVTETSEHEVVRWMIGRDLEEQFGGTAPDNPGQELRLRVEGLTRKGVFADISFSIASGEILGIAGGGAGRTELVESLFGAPPPDAGRIFLDGKEVTIRSPEEARRLGLALVADDRRNKGLVGVLPILENLEVMDLDGKVLSTIRKVPLREVSARDQENREEEDLPREVAWRPDGKGLSFLWLEKRQNEQKEGQAESEPDPSKRTDRLLLLAPPFDMSKVQTLVSGTKRFSQISYSADGRYVFATLTKRGAQNKRRLEVVAYDLSAPQPQQFVLAMEPLTQPISWLTPRSLRPGIAGDDAYNRAA